MAKLLFFSDIAWHSSGWTSAGFIGLDNVLLRMLRTPFSDRTDRQRGSGRPRRLGPLL